jgi:hypothetical protein
MQDAAMQRRSPSRQYEIRGKFQNQPPIGLLKKIQNREPTFIVWNSYIHNCFTLLYGTVTYITALLYYMEQLHT